MWFVGRGRGVLPKFVCVCVFSFKSRPLRRKVTFGILNVGEGDHQSKTKKVRIKRSLSLMDLCQFRENMWCRKLCYFLNRYLLQRQTRLSLCIEGVYELPCQQITSPFHNIHGVRGSFFSYLKTSTSEIGLRKEK